MGRQRIQLLKRLGFEIEDASHFGPEWAGYYRWIRNGYGSGNCYDWELEVWRDAWKHAVTQGLIT